MTKTRKDRNAFTLAEVLITLGVIGVVAAVTMPTLVTNIQERVRKEQVRTVKYKFTKATEKMNSLGKIGRYESTEKFVEELKKHLSIAKVCNSGHLNECWGGESFTNANGSTTYKVAELTSGKSLEALQFNSGNADTVGIVTGDGVSIILTYGKECQALDETKQYTWSTVDGKPETNATAGCVSMVFDINGKKGPNKLGTDVRTMNSLLGMVKLGSTDPLSQADCGKYKNKLGIKSCYGQGDDDYWGGAIKACHDLGMHLPSLATLAKIATMQYGIPIEPAETVYFCSDEVQTNCKTKPENYSSPITTDFIDKVYVWANEEYSGNSATERGFMSSFTYWGYYPLRSYSNRFTLCLSD